MSLLVLIPLVPLLACLLLTLAGRRLGEASHRVGIPAVAIAFGLSIMAFVQVLSHGPQSVDLYRFLRVGAWTVDFGLYVDQVTVVLLLLVTGVSSIVHMYASRYMIGDPRYARFFAVMALVTSAMSMLVMSRNLLMTYMCWEVMGICSYLMLSHWAHRRAAASAATRVFLVTAVADVSFGCSVLLTFQTFGTLDVPTILARAGSLQGQTINLLAWAGFDWSVPSLGLLALLLFAGTLGKSAQLPVHVWLPVAMEAPTPVSAVSYAATTVNAGPFLLLRFSPLLVLAPTAMGVMAVVGGATALFAALVSMTQSDIKKILAYSTISQIGFTIMMCGVGAFTAAVFHLLAHGVLNAFLFLSTGNALQALKPRARQGASAHAATASSWASPAGALVFACMPPLILFSGPYEAMWTLSGVPAARFVFWALALATVFLTAVYLSRGAASLFEQGFALGGSVIRPHLLSVPHALIIVAGALVLASVLFEFPIWFAQFMAPALAHVTNVAPDLPTGERVPTWSIVPWLAAIGGWAYATLPGRTARVRAAQVAARGRGFRDSVYVAFWNKGYFDEVYDAYVVAPNLRFAQVLARRVEHAVVDGVLNGLVSASIRTALWLWRVLEGRGLDRAVSGTASASVVTARWLWRVLEGRGIQGSVDRLSHQADIVGRFFEHREVHTLQEHLLLVVAGLAALLGLFYLVIQWS
jgi:NADH-quinone oxidoreductase subunit L